MNSNEKNHKGIKISPNFYQKDWLDLDLTKNNLDNWNKAIEMFKDRIEGRYFKQIEVLDTNKDRDVGLFSGFAIMSLTCLLIETLEQFWTGNIQTSRKSKTGTKINCLSKLLNSPKKDISNDALTFFSFFQRNDDFKHFFDTEEKANVFYTKIRCGLLHQGQTKGKSLIHIRKLEPILSWIDNNNIDNGISIQRRLFVKNVRAIYEMYISELKKTKNLNFKQSTFKKKMDFIVNQK
jgi:hypothetical protein